MLGLGCAIGGGGCYGLVVDELVAVLDARNDL